MVKNWPTFKNFSISAIHYLTAMTCSVGHSWEIMYTSSREIFKGGLFDQPLTCSLALGWLYMSAQAICSIVLTQIIAFNSYFDNLEKPLTSTHPTVVMSVLCRECPQWTLWAPYGDPLQCCMCFYRDLIICNLF